MESHTADNHSKVIEIESYRANFMRKKQELAEIIARIDARQSNDATPRHAS